MPAAAGSPGRWTRAQHLEWSLDRSSRAFSVKVIEPTTYDPAQHGDLFMKVISELISPTPDLVDGFTSRRNQVRPAMDRFDLTTFPEAFVDVASLLAAVCQTASLGRLGCIHVGLRPTLDSEHHLFSLEQMEDLLERLEGVERVVESDLASFRDWLSVQSEGQFNIGCLFAVDPDGVRVCLHPKAVRSQFEARVLPEDHMTEADLLTVVTLRPPDAALMTVNLQPLICSDALDLPTDLPGGGPLRGLNVHASLFERPPDHIDIVSVATCTPQPEGRRADDQPYREWHDQFAKSFVNLAQGAEYPRHHLAAMVLSNFRQVIGGAAGGLSGLFLPVPPPKDLDQPSMAVSVYGRPASGGASNGWSRPDDQALKTWKGRGYVVGVDPFAEPVGATVKVFSFTLQRLPRDTSRWRTDTVLTQCVIQAGGYVEGGRMVFSPVEVEHDA